MNLFHNNTLLQAVRDAYDLTIPQAICVLIAYQHGTVSTESAKLALDCDAKKLSSVSALSMPVRKKILKEVGKARVRRGSRPSSIYRLVDPDALFRIIDEASDKNMALFRILSEYEQTAKEALK